MDKKIDPSEIVNPKKTLARREAEAGVQPAVGGIEIPGDTGQSKFLHGGKPRTKQTPEEEARKRRSFEELRRKRDAAIKTSSNEFEEEFSRDSGVPLTDAVRAARAVAVEPAMKEDAEYASAYDEEKKSAT